MNVKQLKNIIFAAFLISSILQVKMKLRGQQLYYPLEFSTSQKILAYKNFHHISSFTLSLPLSIENSEESLAIDSILNNPERDNKYLTEHKKTWIYRKIRKEDFIILDVDKFHLRINPLLNLYLMREKDSREKYYTNTRGIEFKGNIDDKFSFYTSFYENQSRFPDYISNYILKHLVVPGQGAAKILNNNKYDYARAEAYISFSPVNFLNIRFGHGKNFIGSGYRSLILSDNSFNYPFIKISTRFNNFQYAILWTQYQLFKGAYYDYHQRKYGAYSSISWLPAKGIEWSVIESINWPGNSPDFPNQFNLNFFNPIPFFRSFQYGLKNKRNINLSTSIRINISKFEQLYGQGVLDEVKLNGTGKNKYAFQLGLKSFDLFRKKFLKHSLFLLAEYNQIAPYTYAHSEVLSSNTHYNQPLAHPSGAGLCEMVGILNYQYKDFEFNLKMNYLLNSVDSLNSNFGSNIFLPDSDKVAGSIIGQGIKSKTTNIDLRLSLLINPSSNLKIFVSMRQRHVDNVLNPQNNIYYSFGIITDLNNYYYDF